MPFRAAAMISFLFAVLLCAGGCSQNAKPNAQDPAKTTPQLDPASAANSNAPRPEPIVQTPNKKLPENPPDANDGKDPNDKPDDGAGKKTNGVVEVQDPKGEKGPKEPKDKDPKAAPVVPVFVVPSEVMGKTYEQWRKQIKAADPSRREEAMRMIRAFGPDKAYEALPDILSELKKQSVDLSVRVNGAQIMGQIIMDKKDPDPKHVADALAIYKTYMKSEQVILKTRAVQSVMALGPKSHEAIEDVMQVARDPATWEVRREGLLVLGRMAKEMKPMHAKVPAELRKAIGDAELSVQVRLLGLQTIAAVKDEMSEKEIKITADAIEARAKKKGEDPVMQIYAYATIMTITGQANKAHLDPVIKFLQHKDNAIQVQAMHAIASVQTKGQPALDALSKIARDGDPSGLRMEALQAMVAVGFDKEKKALHASVLGELTNALDDHAKEMRLYALKTLVDARTVLNKKEKKDALDVLETRTRIEKEAMVRLWIYATLITLTETVSEPHMKPIVEFLKHKEASIRRQALLAIALGGKDARPFAQDAVIDALKDADVTVASAACDALPNLHATDTIPLLKKITEDKTAHPDLIEAAGDAIELLQEIIALEKAQKEKKTPEKK